MSQRSPLPRAGAYPADRRGRFRRLLLCLPLIAVMGAWLFSYGRFDRGQFVIHQTRIQIASSDGKIYFARHYLLANQDVHVPGIRAENSILPWWEVWLAVALMTVLVYLYSRRRAGLP